MNNKEIVSSGKMAETLIGNYLVIGIPFGIVSGIANNILQELISSTVIFIILSIIIQAILVYFLWKICVATAFNKKTIILEDVNKVIKYLLIFAIISSILFIAYNFYETKSNLEETLNSSLELSYYENFVYSAYSDEQIAEYETQKSKAIQESKIKLYTIFTFLEIGLTTVNLGILIFVKKDITLRVSEGV